MKTSHIVLALILSASSAFGATHAAPLVVAQPPPPPPVISAQEKADYAFLLAQINQDIGITANLIRQLPEGSAYFTAKLTGLEIVRALIQSQPLQGYEAEDLEALAISIQTITLLYGPNSPTGAGLYEGQEQVEVLLDTVLAEGTP